MSLKDLTVKFTLVQRFYSYVADHHLQNLVQLAVADVPVVVDVINSAGKSLV